MRRTLSLQPLDDRIVPATYYVSGAGDNGADGSAASPWRTLQFAADTVEAGDTVIVRAGNYVGFNVTTSGQADARITFDADPGVAITAPNASGPHAGRDGINVEGADYVTIDGFTVNGMDRAGIRVVTNTGAIVRNCSADANGRWGILTGFAERVTIENNVTTNSIAEHGIYVSNSADYPIVRGNLIFGNRACGIHMNSDRFSGGDGVIQFALIEGNTIFNNGTGGGSGINMDGVSDSVVRNNLVYGNHATGIGLYMIDGTHGAQNNVIANNTVRVASDGRWALLIVDGSTGNTVFNNILLNDGGYRGSISISPDSLPGFSSDYNVVMNRFTTDDGDSITPFSEWQADGYDAHSVIATAAQTFDADFRLIDGSPALNVGAASFGGKSAPTTDLVGTARPSGGGYDIGAFERPGAAPEQPQVESVTFNDGSAQRSMIRSITVTFDARVTFDANAFIVKKASGAKPKLTVTLSEADGKTSATLTFKGVGTHKTSLRDGNWTLTVRGDRVHRLDAPAVRMDGDSLTTFRRRFGDSDGDGDTDATDREAFQAAFGNASNLATFDFNNDGVVDEKDRKQFNRRFR